MTAFRPPLAAGALAFLMATVLTASPAQAGLEDALPPITIIGTPPEGIPPPLFPPGHITLHRFPDPVGLRMLAGPVGWTCSINGGPEFTYTAPLSIDGSNPSVSCSPPYLTAACLHTTAGGYHTNIQGGAMFVTSSCVGGPQATKRIEAGDPGVAASSLGAGAFPWTCSVYEDDIYHPQEGAVDWWVFCQVNM